MNIKTICRALCASTVLVAFASCDSYLNIKPKGELIPETAADYEKMLNYTQLVKGGDPYPNFLTDDVYLPDEGLLVRFSMAAPSVQNLYTFQSEVFGDGEDDDFWIQSYARIHYFNVVANQVLNATEATLDERRALRAEALMGRAFEYLTLVNAYAKHYDAQTASSDPGVPLILDENIEQSNLKRATVKEVYDQIQRDLDEASKYLPAKPKHNAFRASAPVGYGMRARMYLCMGDYAKALENANLSLKGNNTLLDLKNYTVVKSSLGIGRTNVPDQAGNPENIYIRMAPMVIGLSMKTCLSEDLMSLYDADNDQRVKLYVIQSFGPITDLPNLWVPFLYANVAMATPEMYLIAAECEARIGSKERALELINTLRANRIMNATPLTAATAEEALRLVLEERRRELALTGITRLVDLKRLNKEPRFAKTVTHVVDGKTYTLQPNDPKYVLPIPSVAMRFNKETMVQNPR